MAQTTKNSIALPDPGASAGSWGQVLNDAIESVDVLIDQHKVPNGGTINQVLAKASGTNYDVEWQTIAGMGDTVDSLTGGNGINVSSSAGDVTLSVNANTLRSHLSVEANSKDDQTGAEIKSLYEAESDTNAFTDSEKTKLTNINTATHTLDSDLTSVSTSDDSIASAKAIKDYVDTQDATKQNTIADGDLTIARTSGLQSALDGKQATITDGDLTIARTNGLQTALDGKQATLTNGIANTNNVVIDSTSVADNEFAYFTANGLESLSHDQARVSIDAISQSAFNNLNGQLDTHVANVSNPHSVTKTQVGLSNVENTALSTWGGNTLISDEIIATAIALG